MRLESREVAFRGIRSSCFRQLEDLKAKSGKEVAMCYVL